MPAYIGPGRVHYDDASGRPLSGGKVYVYEAGTMSTLVDVYDDYENAVNEVNPQVNPVTLDTRGEAIIIITGAVDLKVTDSEDNLVWTVSNYSIADALDPSTGGYHFFGNSIVNIDNDIALAFTSATNANSYVQIDSKAANAAPVIKPVCAAVTDQDLVLTPQAAGSIIAKNQLEVDYVGSGGNQIVLTGVAASSHPTITTTGADATVNLVINPKSTGILDIQAATSISGNVTTTGTVVGTQTATFTGIKLQNNSFTCGINAPSLGASAVWTWPATDGSLGQSLITNGSGTLSFGTASPYGLVSAYQASGQSIPDTTPTKLTLSNEDLDPNIIFSTVNSRYSPTRTGYYVMNASMIWAAACSSCTFALYKNGSSIGGGYQRTFANSQAPAANWVISVTSGEYFEVFVSQFTGGALTVNEVKFNAYFLGS